MSDKGADAGAPASAPNVAVDDARSDPDAEPDITDVLDRLPRIVRAVLEGEGISAGTVTVILVDLEDMAEQNREHMGAQGPTDVLSFPLDAPGSPQPPDVVPHLGDILLCVDVAAEQAPSHCGSLHAEIELLAIHGTLHLLGFDHAHADERLEMQRREARYLSLSGLRHPGDQR